MARIVLCDWESTQISGTQLALERERNDIVFPVILDPDDITRALKAIQKAKPDLITFEPYYFLDSYRRYPKFKKLPSFNDVLYFLEIYNVPIILITACNVTELYELGVPFYPTIEKPASVKEILEKIDACLKRK